MATEPRPPTDSLVERLAELQQNSSQFNFYSAVRLLDCLFRDQPRTGTSDRPGYEKLRLGQSPSLRFPPSSIDGLTQRESDKTWHLAILFFGMFGPNGPLPTHITDYAQQRIKHHRDETFARFADIFHHRMAAFFYRAWSACQPTVHLDRPQSDRFAEYLAALCGIGFPTQRNRDAMPDVSKLYFSAHLACANRHASGLKSILQTFFQLPVEILPFTSHWVRLPEDCLWRLGKQQHANELGISITLGHKVRDCQQKFRIAIGPLDYKSFRMLLPYGRSMRRLRSIVDQYIGQELAWDVQLVLSRNEVRGLTLGRQGHLGWTSWLASRPPTNDAQQLIVDPLADNVRRKKFASRDRQALGQDSTEIGA